MNLSCRGMILAFLLMVVSAPAVAQDNGGEGIEILEIDDEAVRTQPGSRSVNRILAVVEDQAITMREYVEEFGDTRLERPRLNRLIDKELIKQAGREAGIILNRRRVETFVDSRIQQVKQQGPGAFQQFLRQRGLTESAYRRRLMNRIRDQRLRSQVLIRNFPQLAQPDTRAAQQLIKGRLMILPDSATAFSVYRSLRASPSMATWNRLFEQHSRKLSFMDEHGELDWFSWGTYSREIEYHFFKNDLFRMSRPFQFRGSYGLVIPTGFRLDTLNESVSNDMFTLYESFRRRYYAEQLSEQLRDRFSVNIPQSVRQEFSGSV